MTLIEALPIWLQAPAEISAGIIGVGLVIGFFFFFLMAWNDREGNS